MTKFFLIHLFVLSALSLVHGKHKKEKRNQPMVYFVKLFLKDGSLVKGQYIDVKDSSINLFTIVKNDTIHHSVSLTHIKKVKTRRRGKFLEVTKWTGLALASGGLIYGFTQLPNGKSGSCIGTIPPVEQLTVGIVVVVGAFVYPFYKLTTYFTKKKYPWQFEDY